MLFLHSKDIIYPTIVILLFPLLISARAIGKSLRGVDENTKRLKAYFPQKIFEFFYILSRQRLHRFWVYFSIVLLLWQLTYLGAFAPLILLSAKVDDFRKIFWMLLSLFLIAVLWMLVLRILLAKTDHVLIEVKWINPEITFLKDCRFGENNVFNESLLKKITKFWTFNSPLNLTKRSQKKFLRWILQVFKFYDLAHEYSKNKSKFSSSAEVTFSDQKSILTLDEIQKKTEQILATCQVQVRILRVCEDTIVNKYLTRELWNGVQNLK